MRPIALLLLLWGLLIPPLRMSCWVLVLRVLILVLLVVVCRAVTR